MLVLGCLLVALTLSQAAPAAEQTGRVSGRVTAQGANTPLAGVRITLIPTTRPTIPMGMPPQALTDQDGRYVFDRVVPGSYRVSADRNGYAPLDAMNRPALQIAAGHSLAFDVQLQKGAAITGKVMDPSGEPLTDARVMVLRRIPMPAAGGRGLPPMPRLIPAGGSGAQTNDLGEFRVSGLAPGEYFVAVSPRSNTIFGTAYSSPARDLKIARTTLPTTYYPGTSDQAAAQPIAVAAGAEVGNIFITMQSVPAFRVSGVVVDEDGKPIDGAMVMLMGDPRSGGMMGPLGNSVSQPNGRFDIDSVPAGNYRINASVMMRMNGSGGGAGGGAGIGGASATWSSTSGSGPGTTVQPVEVVVADADVTDVRVVARRPNRQ